MVDFVDMIIDHNTLVQYKCKFLVFLLFFNTLTHFTHYIPVSKSKINFNNSMSLDGLHINAEIEQAYAKSVFFLCKTSRRMLV